MNANRSKRKKAIPAPEQLEMKNMIAFPAWPDDQAPPEMRIYNFAVKGMILLAAGCPDPAIQLAAFKTLRDEFSPKAAAGVSASITEVEVIAKLRQALASEPPLDEAETELEREVTGTVALPPVRETKETP